MSKFFAVAAGALLFGALLAGSAMAQQASVSVSVKNGQFQPREIRAPANAPLTLTVKNLDAKPMEFESVSLRVEKVVPGNSSGLVRIRALSPGRYQFFDDFNPSNIGMLVVE
jgi:hypothetical protein